MKKFTSHIASMFSLLLTMVLFIGANSNSSFLMHQKKAPSAIERFRKI